MTLDRNGMVSRLQEQLLNMDQADCPVKHSFMPGMYLREATFPADSVIVGKWHKTWHVNILTKGRMTVFLPDGTTQELIAPITFLGSPGQKCAYVHEEATWINVYHATETDVDALEDKLYDLSRTPKIVGKHDLKMIDDARQQYSNFLDDIGVTEEDVFAIASDESDMVPLPFAQYSFKVSDSPIAGKGIFATSNIKKGDVIGPARIENNRTVLGRYMNHSSKPNCEFVSVGNWIMAVATDDIKGCVGAMDGEEILSDYRNNLLVSKGEICQPS